MPCLFLVSVRLFFFSRGRPLSSNLFKETALWRSNGSPPSDQAEVQTLRPRAGLDVGYVPTVLGIGRGLNDGLGPGSRQKRSCEDDQERWRESSRSSDMGWGYRALLIDD